VAIASQIANKPADQVFRFYSHLVETVKLLPRDVEMIKVYVKVRLDFRCRPPRINQKLDELPVALAIESLGDIGHHRDGCSSHLIPQSKVFGQLTSFRHLVNSLRKLPSFFPGIDILKPRDFSLLYV
jgi:hypothetical protein